MLGYQTNTNILYAKSCFMIPFLLDQKREEGRVADPNKPTRDYSDLGFHKLILGLIRIS